MGTGDGVDVGATQLRALNVLEAVDSTVPFVACKTAV